MPPLLTQMEIDERLGSLDGWRHDGSYIVKELAFPSFKAAMEFVNRVADVSEEIDHHPNMTIVYTRVSLSITTHSEGGITHRDFRLAGLINGLG